jgi:hypothetical protein
MQSQTVTVRIGSDLRNRAEEAQINFREVLESAVAERLGDLALAEATARLSNFIRDEKNDARLYDISASLYYLPGEGEGFPMPVVRWVTNQLGFHQKYYYSVKLALDKAYELR